MKRYGKNISQGAYITIRSNLNTYCYSLKLDLKLGHIKVVWKVKVKLQFSYLETLLFVLFHFLTFVIF